MNLSRKAKKRLLILGLLSSPFVVLFIAYLFNIGEPVEYKALRERVEKQIQANGEKQLSEADVSVATQVTTGTVVVSKVELIEPRFGVYSIDQIDPLRGLKWRGPKSSYYVVQPMVVDTNTLEKVICQRIQHVINSTLYRGESSFLAPIEDKENLRLTLDQFLKKYPLNDQVDVKELARPYFDDFFRGDFSSLLIFAAYREIQLGNDEAVRKIYEFYTDYITEALISGRNLPLRNLSVNGNKSANLYLTFSWMVLESDVLNQEERDAVKQRFLDIYQMDTEMKVTPEIKARRDQMIFSYCESRLAKMDFKSGTSFNYFLKDAFGGVPGKAFYGVVNPLVASKVQEFAVALSEMDTKRMKTIREELAFTGPFMDVVEELESIEWSIFTESKGMMYPELLEMFPEFKENLSRKSMAYNYACLIELCDYYREHGEYPLGEFSTSFTSEEFSQKNKFFVLQIDGVEETIELYDGIKEKAREAIKQIPPRVYIAVGHQNHALERDRVSFSIFADERFDILGSLLYEPKPWHSQEELEHLRSSPVQRATAYEWSFRFWEESKDSLDGLLLEEE